MLIFVDKDILVLCFIFLWFEYTFLGMHRISDETLRNSYVKVNSGKIIINDKKQLIWNDQKQFRIMKFIKWMMEMVCLSTAACDSFYITLEPDKFTLIF